MKCESGNCMFFKFFLRSAGLLKNSCNNIATMLAIVQYARKIIMFMIYIDLLMILYNDPELLNWKDHACSDVPLRFFYSY